MSQVGQNIRQALAPNEGATLIGFPGAQPNVFTARYIQQDSSDPTRGGTVVGSAAAAPPTAPPRPPARSQPSASPSASSGPVDEKGWTEKSTGPCSRSTVHVSR